MTADLYYGGTEPFALCTRSVLKRVEERAMSAGYRMQLGIEPELFVTRSFADHPGPDGYLQPSAPSGQLRPTPAYDVESTLDMMPYMDEMVRAMNACGFGVFSFDHEGGDGQVEFDFDYAPALVMADRMTLFRLMAKQIAKQMGLEATFMPKPYTDGWGSGAHFNMSLVDDAGENLFRDADDARGRGWSKKAYGFVAGILRHAPALAAICTPTVNSYKRLQPRLADGTVSWARPGPRTATTTAPACSGFPATGRPSRTGAWTPRPIPISPRHFSWLPASRAWTRARPGRTGRGPYLRLGHRRARGRRPDRDPTAENPPRGHRGLRRRSTRP